MKQKMRVSPENLEVGLEGEQSQVGRATLGMGRGNGKICWPEYKYAEEDKAASSVKTSALALVVVLSPATLSSLFSLFSSQAMQAWGLCLCPLLP